MIHAYRPQFVALLMALGALVTVSPVRALDLEGLDDVTMRVIDANEKPGKLAPQMIALPKPHSPSIVTTVTHGATNPAKSGTRSTGPTAIGVTKAK